MPSVVSPFPSLNVALFTLPHGFSLLRQLLGMKGAAETDDLLKIRVQLMKPVTWIPLIWGVVRTAGREGGREEGRDGIRMRRRPELYREWTVRAIWPVSIFKKSGGRRTRFWCLSGSTQIPSSLPLSLPPCLIPLTGLRCCGERELPLGQSVRPG